MQNKIFTVLALGDVVGRAATDFVCENLFRLKKLYDADFVVVNAENCSESNGTDVRSAQALFESGADVLTGGNHTVKLHEIFDFLDENEYILRPVNLPPLCPGKGSALIKTRDGLNVLAISAMGQVFMHSCDNPFIAVDRVLKEYSGRYDLCICDFHAEATSEKNAFAEYFDGRIHIMFGTHTHVQTADERLLPKGSAFITDLGMCGVDGSILGVRSDAVIKQFVTFVHNRFERASGEIALCGAVYRFNLETKCVTDIRRIKYNEKDVTK